MGPTSSDALCTRKRTYLPSARRELRSYIRVHAERRSQLTRGNPCRKPSAPPERGRAPAALQAQHLHRSPSGPRPLPSGPRPLLHLPLTPGRSGGACAISSPGSVTQQSARLLFSDGIYHAMTTSRGRDQLPSFLSRIASSSSGSEMLQAAGRSIQRPRGGRGGGRLLCVCAAGTLDSAGRRVWPHPPGNRR